MDEAPIRIVIELSGPLPQDTSEEFPVLTIAVNGVEGKEKRTMEAEVHLIMTLAIASQIKEATGGSPRGLQLLHNLVDAAWSAIGDVKSVDGMSIPGLLHNTVKA